MDAATSRILWGRMAYDRGRSAAGKTQTAGRIRRPGMNHITRSLSGRLDTVDPRSGDPENAHNGGAWS